MIKQLLFWKLCCGTKLRARGVTYVKTYVNMLEQRIFKWTHISEVHSCRITPFSEPLHHKHTLISDVHPQT